MPTEYLEYKGMPDEYRYIVNVDYADNNKHIECSCAKCVADRTIKEAKMTLEK